MRPDPDRFDPVDLCAPQERAVHIGWIDVVPDLELQRSRTTMPGRMGDLALRRRPGENPVLHSVDSTKRS